MTLLWLLSSVADVAQDPAVQRGIVDYLKTVGELVGTLTVILGAAWWLVWPRVRDGIENIVVKVNETHHSVTVNGGKSNPPTFRDDVSKVATDLTDARKDIRELISTQAAAARELGELRSEVSDAKGIAEDARDTLQHHVASGERYLGQVQIVLKEHGIEIPSGDD